MFKFFFNEVSKHNILKKIPGILGHNNKCPIYRSVGGPAMYMKCCECFFF